MPKPDDKTWEEYIYDGEGREESWEEFGEEMTTEVRAALEGSELDASRYVVEERHRPSVGSDGWQMTEKGDVLKLRDVLRCHSNPHT